MNKICEVCNKECSDSTALNFHYCILQKEYIKEFHRTIHYRHYSFTTINNEITNKLITIPSIKFVYYINYDDNYSIISKIAPPFHDDEDFKEIELLKLNTTLDLPWSDPAALEEKTKKYLIFS